MPETLPQYLYQKSKKADCRRVAYRYKNLGIWQPTTWSEYFEKVKWIGLGLLSLGMEKDDKVAVIGGNRAECFICMLAAQAVGGVSVGIYSESNAEEIAYQLNHTDCSFVIAEDQEQVDKLLSQISSISNVKMIIYFESRGLWNYNHPKIMAWEELEGLGKEADAGNPALFVESLERGKAGDVALICWTSGSTAHPKAVMISHSNFIASIRAFQEVVPLDESGDYLSMLPVAWIGEIIFGLAGSIIAGYRVNFPESPDVAMQNFREIAPTIALLPVATLNSIVNNIKFRVMESTFLKRRVYTKALDFAISYTENLIAKKPIGLGSKLLRLIAFSTCIWRIREIYGLRRLKVFITGGAGLGPDIFRFMHALETPLRIVYGQSESTVFCTTHHDGNVNPDSAGKPVGHVEVRISEEGEILSRGPLVFKGYYKDEEETRNVLDEDGWLHSGDAGEWTRDGELVVIDRLKDLMKLKDGTRFSPQYIENKLKFCQFIQEVVVFGHERDYIAALINIDMQVVGKWCESQKIGYTTYSDISANKDVGKLIIKQVKEINESLPPSNRIKKFVLLPKELDADDDELTRTKKVKRNVIYERYKNVIDSLFSDQEQVHLDLEIKYQDGGISSLSSGIVIHKV